MKTENTNENKTLSSEIETPEEDYLIYKDFFENMPNAFCIMDKNGKFLEVNKATAQMFGYPKSFLRGKSGGELRAPGESRYSEAVSRALTGETVEFEFWGVRSDGEIFPKTVRLSKGEYKGEDVVYAVGLDITDLKRREEELKKVKVQLRESERLRSSFLDNMSYEIRTPLNGILGFAGLLKDSMMEQEEREKFLDIIKQSGERMLIVLDDLINISKIEFGQLTATYGNVYLSGLLDDIYDSFSSEVNSKGLDMVVSIDPLLKESYIETDREKVFAILSNIVQNAIKFSDSGTIQITCSPKRDGIEFSVQDQGVGIYKDKQESIFDRVPHTGITDRISAQGGSFGLAVSRSYVELLGGKIWVESMPYKGSSFFFTLPNTKTTSFAENNSGNISSTPEKVNENSRLKSLKVLIAEDDYESSLFLSTALKRMVKEVIVARNGKEAVTLFNETEGIDLILMDIKMPEMNGYEATKEIRAKGIPVIIIAQTAFGLTGDAQKAIDAGCDDHISKPIKIAFLKNKISHFFPELPEASGETDAVK